MVKLKAQKRETEREYGSTSSRVVVGQNTTLAVVRFSFELDLTQTGSLRSGHPKFMGLFIGPAQFNEKG